MNLALRDTSLAFDDPNPPAGILLGRHCRLLVRCALRATLHRRSWRTCISNVPTLWQGYVRNIYLRQVGDTEMGNKYAKEGIGQIGERVLACIHSQGGRRRSRYGSSRPSGDL